MSVINRVLQDLEDRRGGVPPPAAVRAVGTGTHRGPRPAVLAGVGVVVILAAGALAAWMAGWFDRAAPVPAPVVVGKPLEPPAAPAEPSAAVPSQPPQAATPAPASPPPRPEPAAMPSKAPAATVAAEAKPARPATAKPPAPLEAAAKPAASEAKPTTSEAASGPAAQPVATAPDARTTKRTTQRERAAAAPAAAAEELAEASPPQAIDKRERPLSAAERGEALYRQGVAQIQSGRSTEAEAAFRQALAEDPRHPGARQALLGMMLDGRRSAEAEALMREGIASDPTQSSWSMVLARLQAERGDTAGGIETLRTALAQNARQSGEFHALLAALLQRAGDHKGAVQSYQDALANPAARPVWHMGQAISLRELGRKDEARTAFQRALDGGLPAELRAFVERQIAALGR